MKIVIPTAEGKLCAHFGHCESFTFAEINPETKEIIKVEELIPEDGISCQSANWIAQQGADVILVGGMGGRPLEIFAKNGVQVVAGCPEHGIKEILSEYVNSTLVTGQNSCGGEHHHCHHEGSCHHH